jgi:hypothetical protein
MYTHTHTHRNEFLPSRILPFLHVFRWSNYSRFVSSNRTENWWRNVISLSPLF